MMNCIIGMLDATAKEKDFGFLFWFLGLLIGMQVVNRANAGKVSFFFRVQITYLRYLWKLEKLHHS